MAARRREAHGRRRDVRSSPVGGSLALFAEVVIVGVVVAVLSVPLVTALPAAAGGARHLTRHLRGEPDDLRGLLSLVRRATSTCWGVSAAAVLVLAVLVFDVSLLRLATGPAVVLPAVVSVLAGAALLVVLLRAAAAWYPGAAWRSLVREAVGRARRDASGSGLVLLALALAGLLVWMLLPLVLVVGGLLVLAAVSVEQRATARS